MINCRIFRIWLLFNILDTVYTLNNDSNKKCFFAVHEAKESVFRTKESNEGKKQSWETSTEEAGSEGGEEKGDDQADTSSEREDSNSQIRQ